MGDASDLVLPVLRTGDAAIDTYARRVSRAIEILSKKSSGGSSVTWAGDLETSTDDSQTVHAIQGVVVSGTPTTGQVLTATSGVAADWQTPSASAPGSWTTVLDIDFTTQLSQNIKAGGDGNYTIGGLVFKVAGTANVSAYDVLPGQGVVWVHNANTVVATSFQILWSLCAPLTPYKVFNGGEETEISWQVSYSAPNVTNEALYVQWGDDTGAIDKLSTGFLYSGGFKQGFFRYSEPGSTTLIQSNSGTTTGNTNDAFRINVANGTLGFCYTGAYSSGWPRGWFMRGFHQSAIQISEWIQFGNDQHTTVTYLTGSTTCVGRTVTISRVRIRIKAR